MTTETEELTEQEYEAQKRAERLDSMDMLLDFLRNNPVIPLPRWGYVSSYNWENDNLKDVVKAMSPCDKEVTESFFKLATRIGDIEFSTNFNRDDVCEKKVIGTREVAEVTYEAHTVDIVEWTCPDSLLGGNDE